ncbi:thermoresistant gluconokinase family protein [Paecilomyces variotii No. 5]|uniref:Gluconokinase n=1 Tax=Byssochlamys spectabilis (strain No. 5 / NBRC 109023) TaxID=1356009 RepID=V5GEL8_BYSSN|nr:thermoresistant gluconokinase family protein [Paecilomyces variotii No. 5]
MLTADGRTQPSLNPAVVGLPRAQAARPVKSYNVTVQQTDMPAEKLQHIWVVTGPAGCGKTTVAKDLQAKLGLPFLEGDDFHPQPNKEKMANGIPLTDADRWDWLISLREAAIQTLSATDDCPTAPSGVIVTCSALKRKYRDVMRVAAYGHPSVRIHFIYLRADENVLMDRVTKRKNHYMKDNMVHSQVSLLEEPVNEWDAVAVDVAAPPDEVANRVITAVRATMAE